MLPKKNRLLDKKDFRVVFQKGVKQQGQFLVLYARASAGTDTRVGFVVGKTVSKGSVTRNQAKRRLREAMRGFLGVLLKTSDIVVVSLPSIRGKRLKEIEEDLKLTLEKRGVL